MGTAARPGRIFIFIGVSGTGKSTICERLAADGHGLLSVSCTTRPRSAQEVEGQHYRFVDRDEFARLLAADELAEHAEVHGQLYGTCRAWLDGAYERGEAILLDIDIAGAKQVRARYERCCIIFLLPPSLAVLEQRLRGRRRESEDEIRRRLRHGLDEIMQLEEADYLLVNDDLERAYALSRRIVTEEDAEELRAAKQEAIARQWLQTARDRLESLHHG